MNLHPDGFCFVLLCLSQRGGLYLKINRGMDSSGLCQDIRAGQVVRRAFVMSAGKASAGLCIVLDVFF